MNRTYTNKEITDLINDFRTFFKNRDIAPNEVPYFIALFLSVICKNGDMGMDIGTALQFIIEFAEKINSNLVVAVKDSIDLN